MHKPFIPNPKLDLVLERIVDVPRERVWKAWTTPAQLMQWFTPKPWQTTQCESDLRPGGAFHTVMRGPQGESQDHTGCYLEVVENEKLVWTDALEGNFRPAAAPNPCTGGHFTAMLLLEPHGKNGTKYTAIAMHSDEAARKKHEEIGFHQGLGHRPRPARRLH